MDLAAAWLATRVLAGLALLQQAAELRQLAPAYSETGPWSWELLREELPASRVLDSLYSGTRLAWLQGFAALALLGSDYAAPLALATTLLVALRFRGSLNGGADSMTLVVMTALTIGCFAKLKGLCLGYVAFQCVASYVLAGCCKLRRASWRRGLAVHRLLHESAYDVPDACRRFFRGSARCYVAAWSVIGFELAFLSLPCLPQLAPLLISAGLLFHLANFAVLGLNRFFWIWAATYPALLYLTRV